MIRKKLIEDSSTEPENWLDLARAATFEVTSEEAEHPIEHALTKSTDKWIASTTGEQTIRMRFDEAQRISRIFLLFEETATPRSQEFVIRWLRAGETTWREVVRQQFNFSPPNTTEERENFTVCLEAVDALELRIIPERGGGGRASLSQLYIG
jgi:hypothetical protein